MTIQTSRKGDSGTARSAGSWGERGQAWGAAAADLCGGKPKDPGTLTAEPRLGTSQLSSTTFAKPLTSLIHSLESLKPQCRLQTASKKS